jgi:hypothetical protein
MSTFHSSSSATRIGHRCLHSTHSTVLLVLVCVLVRRAFSSSAVVAVAVTVLVSALLLCLSSAELVVTVTVVAVAIVVAVSMLYSFGVVNMFDVKLYFVVVVPFSVFVVSKDFEDEDRDENEKRKDCARAGPPKRAWCFHWDTQIYHVQLHTINLSLPVKNSNATNFVLNF